MLISRPYTPFTFFKLNQMKPCSFWKRYVQNPLQMLRKYLVSCNCFKTRGDIHYVQISYYSSVNSCRTNREIVSRKLSLHIIWYHFTLLNEIHPAYSGREVFSCSAEWKGLQSHWVIFLNNSSTQPVSSWIQTLQKKLSCQTINFYCCQTVYLLMASTFKCRCVCFGHISKPC